jgi:CRP/FNR family cyclic AMP-dependent transcriptional regulator
MRTESRAPARSISTRSRDFPTKFNKGKSGESCLRKHVIFSQGDPADAVFYLQKGHVALTVVSKRGKQATVGMLGADEFFGEGSLAGQPVRMSTATVTEDATVLRIKKKDAFRLLHADQKFSELFTAYLISRNNRFEADLVDQLFNSSEKRLARVLLLLTHFGLEGRAEPIIPKISQETLAGMVGTTRARVSHFMGKFRKLGFIDYDGGLRVHSSLLNIVLKD